MSEQDWESLRNDLLLPSGNEAWNEMSATLDQHLPPAAKPKERKRRRFLLLLLLLNLPVIGWLLFNNVEEKQAAKLVTSGQQASSPSATSSRQQPPANAIVSSAKKIDSESESKSKGTSDTLSLSVSVPEKTYADKPAFPGGDIRKVGPESSLKKRENRPSNTLSEGRAETNPVNKKRNRQGLPDTRSGKQAGRSSRQESTSQHITDRVAIANADTIAAQNEQISPVVEKKAEMAKTPKTPDSLPATTNTEKNGQENKDLIVTAGLQWNLQLPSSGPSQYFTGPNLSFQPYRNLIPGAWLRVQVERSAIIADFSPFYATLVGSSTHFTQFESVRAGDTIVNTTEVRSMRKNFGVGAGIGYEYQLLPQWWLGIGFHSYWWNKAIGKASGLEERIPLNGSGKIIRNYERNYIIPSNEFQYFRKSQQNLSFTALYTSNRWQGGLRAGFTFSSLAKRDGPRNLTRLDFLFRLPLIGARRK